MKIEDTLEELDKGLDDFIRSQKDKIRSERFELSPRQANGAHHDGDLHQSLPSRNSPSRQTPASPRKQAQLASVVDSVSPRLLSNDYKEFLINKQRAIGGSAMRDAIGQSNKKASISNRRVIPNESSSVPKANTVALSETYDELMKRKRLEEQNYRQAFQDPETTTPTNSPSNFGNSEKQGNATINQTRSDSANLKQQRQRAYREALQEQIREKQLQKQREKMEWGQSPIEYGDTRAHRGNNSYDSPPQSQPDTMKPQAAPASIAKEAPTTFSADSMLPPPAMNGFGPAPSVPQSLNPYFPMVYNPYITGLLQASTNGSLNYDMHSLMNNGPNIHAFNNNSNINHMPMNAPAAASVSPPRASVLSNRGSLERSSGRFSLDQLPSEATPTNNPTSSNPKQQYHTILKQQMREKQEAKDREKQERNRYEAKLGAEKTIYDPWGKAGAGAPIKDNSGKVVADLRKMHHYNQEGIILSPRHQVDRTGQFSPKTATAFGSLDPQSAAGLEQSFNADTISGPGSKPLKNFAAVVDHTTGAKGVSKQDDYKEFLRQQVEEKRRLKKEEEERQKLEEEKENLRVEKQRIQMQTEFEAEQEKQRQKEIKLRQQNEELVKIAEQKRKEAEMEQKRLDEARHSEQRMRAQEDLQARLQSSMSDGSKPSKAFRAAFSPPIQQQRHQQQQRRAPLKEAFSYESEMAIDLSGLDNEDQSPPLSLGQRKPHVSLSDRDYLNSVRQTIASSQSLRDVLDQGFEESKGPMKKEELLSKLMCLRQRLDDEEHKIEKELEDHKAAYANIRSTSSKRRARQAFDKARQGNTTTSSRPNSKLSSVESEGSSLQEASHSVPVQEAKQMQQPRDDNNGVIDQLKLSEQQQALMREQEAQLQSLRSIISRAEKHFSGLATHERQPQVEANGEPRLDSRSSRTSMLASDSHEIEFDSTSEAPSRQSTARRQRRWKKLHEMAVKDTLDGGVPLFDDMAGSQSRAQSTTRRHLDLDQVSTRNEERLKMLRGQPPMQRE